MLQAFKLAMEAAGGASAESTMFFDDSTRNIAAGSKFGLYTVLVGRQGADIGAQMEVLTKPCLTSNPTSILGAHLISIL